MNKKSNTKKLYHSSPLPFMGQKRAWRADFIELLKKTKHPIIIDAFGGSGLLSHYAKYARPDARVIWNDFDCYYKRLEEIPNTNRLLNKIREYLESDGRNYERHDRLAQQDSEWVIRAVEEEMEKGYVDVITLGARISFTRRHLKDWRQIKKEKLYFNFPITKFNLTADGYINGFERVRESAFELFKKFGGGENILWVLDPPYFNTLNAQYSEISNSEQFLIYDFLREHEFIYFTSRQSYSAEILALMQTYGILKGKIGTKDRALSGVGLKNNRDLMFYRAKGIPFDFFDDKSRLLPGLEI